MEPTNIKMYLLGLSYRTILMHGYELFKNIQSVLFNLFPSTAFLSDRRLASAGISCESYRAQRHDKMGRL
jgi:hypothetical protein